MSFIGDKLSIIFKQPFTQSIGLLEVDIVGSRSISEKIEITNNPVENGFNTDNARDDPTEFSLDGTISKYSLKNSKVNQIKTLISGSIPNRLKDAHDELYRIRDAKEPIVIVGKFKEYNNMLLSSLEFRDDANSGDTLRFVVTFKEVRIVESQMGIVGNASIKTDSAKKESFLGRQTGVSGVVPKATSATQTLSQFIKNIF